MPRVAGQIDLAKNEAILDAALEVLATRGLAAPIEQIARRAGVSKQTIYNHYGSKADLIRAISLRRLHQIRGQLGTDEAAMHPEEALAAYAREVLETLARPRPLAIMRLAIAGAGEAPELANALYEYGPRAIIDELARFIGLETAAGRMNAPDPHQAAEFFSGMVGGSRQSAGLLGVEAPLSDARIDAIAREAAARFMRAYAP